MNAALDKEAQAVAAAARKKKLSARCLMQRACSALIS